MVPPQFITTQLVKGRRRFDIDSSYLLRSETASELIVEAAQNEHICEDCEKERNDRSRSKNKSSPFSLSNAPSLVLNALDFK